MKWNLNSSTCTEARVRQVKSALAQNFLTNSNYCIIQICTQNSHHWAFESWLFLLCSHASLHRMNLIWWEFLSSFYRIGGPKQTYWLKSQQPKHTHTHTLNLLRGLKSAYFPSAKLCSLTVRAQQPREISLKNATTLQIHREKTNASI